MDKVLLSMLLLVICVGANSKPIKTNKENFYQQLKLIEEDRLLDLRATASKLQAISRYKDRFNKKELETFNLLLGHSQLMLSKIKQSEKTLVNLSENSDFLDIKARASSILTSLYILRGDNVESFMALDRALNMLPKVEDEQYKFDILANSVSVYKESELLEFALEHARHLLSIANKQKTDLALCNGMFELGDIENIAGKKNIAKSRLMAARGHCEKSEETLVTIMVDESLARIDIYEGEYKKALVRLSKSYTTANDYGWGVMISIYQIRFGEVYYKLQDLEKSLSYAKSAYSIAKKGKDEKRIELAAALLAKVYSDMGDKDKAIKYFKEYMEKNNGNDAKIRQRKLAFDIARRGKL